MTFKKEINLHLKCSQAGVTVVTPEQVRVNLQWSEVEETGQVLPGYLKHNEVLAAFLISLIECWFGDHFSG